MMKNDIRIIRNTIIFNLKRKMYNLILILTKTIGANYISFSQNGEDLMFGKINSSLSGFYVDIGCNHPIRDNNTYQLWLKGWHGMNIDPYTPAIDLFKKARPKDINLNVGISDTSGSMTYYAFEESRYNTLDDNTAENRVKTGVSKLLEKKRVQVETLNSVFKEYNVKIIDYLTLDVEHNELNVLKSNDWEQYRPKFICIESTDVYKAALHGLSILDAFMKDDAISFLIEQGYIIIGFQGKSALLRDEYTTLC